MASHEPKPLIEVFSEPPRFADRVVELRRVRANEIRPNPHNWRVHPEAQSAALQGVLEDIGFADAVIARETPDGLELVDGHLRQELLQDDLIPVLVVDINEEEAKRMLVTLDPLAAMAETNHAALESLIDSLHFENEAVIAMLEDLSSERLIPLPEADSPAQFPSYGDDIATEHRCPQCGYEWSGQST
jgi:hypothetical protein